MKPENSLPPSQNLSRRSHLKLVQCHHEMAYPQVTDRGDGLHIGRGGVNVLNESGAGRKGGPPTSSLGFNHGL
jgi:hypothetical protein